MALPIWPKIKNLDHQVAIKEYFPSSFSSRDAQDSTVKPITATQEDVLDSTNKCIT
ncbi:MAG: hypothetical protein HRU20_10345 [Pseudomonadales bacterium]|nr:hypothetical protein [Pseudomonadales bacterium]